MKTFTCGHCGKIIFSLPGDKLYRTCDAYVCNPICQRERVAAISKIDPNMDNPLSWTYDLSSKSSSATIKRKSSLVGLQDLENGDERLSIIVTKTNERDNSNIVTFENKNDLKLPPNKPYEYIMITFAIIGSTLLLLSL